MSQIIVARNQAFADRWFQRTVVNLFITIVTAENGILLATAARTHLPLPRIAAITRVRRLVHVSNISPRTGEVPVPGWIVIWIRGLLGTGRAVPRSHMIGRVSEAGTVARAVIIEDRAIRISCIVHRRCGRDHGSEFGAAWENPLL